MTVQSPNAVAMNVACPTCRASIAQHCIRMIDDLSTVYFPLGEVHVERQQAFLDRQEQEKM